MNSQSIFLKILFVYMAAFAILQAYFYFRIRKAKQNSGTEADPHLTSKATLLFGLFHASFFIFGVTWVLYYIRQGFMSVGVGVVLIFIGFMMERKPISMVLKNRPRPVGFSVNLTLQRSHTGNVTPEYIEDILSERSVIAAIRNDLKHVPQIGGQERWRLGLIIPGKDEIDPSAMRLPLTRAAVLHSSKPFNHQFDNIQIRQLTDLPVMESYRGVRYSLDSKIAKNELTLLRDVRVAANPGPSQETSCCLTAFLREQGFPLKESYLDADPLLTERCGTIIFDRGAIKIIYPNYFVQRSLIDDEGHLIYMGLDENFRDDSLWDGIALIPSVSERLYKAVEYHGFVPIVRYRSFPYNSDFMLPILDTPMSDSGWADLFIDPRGRARLYVAKQKTLQEWYQLMERLRQLFFYELARKGNHLLGLTKDSHHLYEYFCRKKAILDDYFIAIDWSLS